MLSRYYHTIRYLRPDQLFFQGWYRIKRALPFRESYSDYDSFQIHRLQFDAFELVNSREKYKGNLQFCFLNKIHRFHQQIDWNFGGNGRLWNYNLQYLDFLLDEGINTSETEAILESCCAAILNGTLKLEPYPVSLRLINQLLYNSRTGYNTASFVRSVRLQLSFLRKNLEYHILANHLLENIVALLVGALFLKDSKLLDFSTKKLRQQLEEQILPDGAHYECSPMYHVIILSRLLLVRRLLQCNGLSTHIDGLLDQKIALMLGWLKAFTFSDGRYALLNDSSPDIAPGLDDLYKVSDRAGITIPRVELGASGYRKMTTSRMELLIDIGPIIPSYQPGHAHSDMLSFCMQLDKQDIFIDPGVSTYDAGAQRSLERSTAFHNTVTIDGLNQSDVWSAFRVGRRAAITSLHDQPEKIECAHDGYFSSLGIIHKRVFQQDENQLRISDYLDGKRGKIGIAHFFLAPGVEVVQEEGGSLLIAGALRAVFENQHGVMLHRVSVPDGYNRYVETSKIEVRFADRLCTTFIPI